MYRADGHLVDLLAFHAVVVIIAGNVICVVVAEDVRPAREIGMIAHHLQPGVPLGPDAELFGDFPFKHVKRFTLAAQGRVGIRGVTAGHQQPVVAQDCHEFEGIVFPVGKEVNDHSPVTHNIEGFPAKLVKCQVGDPFPGNSNTVINF